MKFKITVTAVVVLALFLFSCNAVPVNYSSSKSWFMPENGKAKRTIRLVGVSVDRSGGWDSLEKEVAVLAPLYFWEKGFYLVESDDPAAYVVHISLRERDFPAGWNTRRSISLEVRIWTCKGESAGELPGRLPIAAGRVVVIGNKSFSSSKTTEKMLSRAVYKTVRKLR
jgi:hypothetical protein